MFLPAFLIMGLAGSPIQLAVLPCCNEFRLPAVAMTIYSGVFAAAALVFPLFEVSSVVVFCPVTVECTHQGLLWLVVFWHAGSLCVCARSWPRTMGMLGIVRYSCYMYV